MKTEKLTLKLLQWNSGQLLKCKNLKQLSVLLGCTKNQLVLSAFNPMYYHFQVPKKNGDYRQIEAPSLELKTIQRRLNKYLQAVYYLNQSKVSYGYVVKTINDKNPKNIYTNALSHLGNGYMLNADFKDFFHQITLIDVTTIFKSHFFNFDTYTAHTLAKICCYNNRLPMGAPTSPVLSNLYSIALDTDLTNWADSQNITFTRFVDDLTFSSNTTPLSTIHFEKIKKIAAQYHLKFNATKTKFYGKKDLKTVTNLVLNKTVDIDAEYYIELEKDIIRLKNVMEVYHITGKVQNITFLKTFKQELFGKINFISIIEGKESKEFLHYLNSYYEALQPNNDLVQRWTKFSTYL